MAAKDISEELYANIKKSFDAKYENAQLLGEPLHGVFVRIKSGDATFRDADMYSVEVGSMLSDSMKEYITLDDMPNRTLYRNIAQKTIGTGLKDGYGLVSNITSVIQEEMNAAAGIGLKPVKPKLDVQAVDNIVDRAVAAKTQEELDGVLAEPVKTFTRRVADDSAKANARMHNRAGLEVKVEREYDGVGLHNGTDVCDWCKQREGTWTYNKAMAAGVFERHEGCGCEIIYTSRKGVSSRQVSWQKNEWQEGKRNALVEEAKRKNVERRKLAEERRRNRLLKLGNTRDFQRLHNTVSTKKLEHFTLNNLYIANDVNLKPREIRRINKQITQAKELLSLTNDCKAPIVIVNDNTTLASYNPHTDTFFISASMADSSKIPELQKLFTCSNDERSTMVHELFHWRDAEDYRLSGKAIDDASNNSEYSIFQREKAHRKLVEAGIDLQNLGTINKEISTYAYRMCLENNYEEVYTEYRTLKAIMGFKK